MSIGIHRKSRWLAVGVGMVLVSAGCATMEPKNERYVAPAAGTTYEHTRRDTGSYGSSTVSIPGTYLGEKMWNGQRVHVFENPEQTILGATGDWFAFISVVKGQTPILTWNPPIAWQRPLMVGKKWTRKYSMTIHAANRTIDVEDAQEVEAFEDVTVPAGTFKTWKVRTIDNQGNDNVQWYAPDLGIYVKQSLRRTNRHAAGLGTREIDMTAYKRGGS